MVPYLIEIYSTVPVPNLLFQIPLYSADHDRIISYTAKPVVVIEFEVELKVLKIHTQA